ncbi:MAG: bifunctional riboflavin kinase/FAD synthetase [Ferruginibacter sp.]
MNVYRNINDLPRFENAVVTVGSFDGVHLGHRKILQQLLSEAEKINGTPLVVTFYPHPKQVLQNLSSPLLTLNTASEKYNILHSEGIENIIEVPFDETFSKLTAAEYIKSFLVEKLHIHTIITGYDHRFGNNREGDFHLLETASLQYGFKVKEIPAHILKNLTISSTKIRAALLKADLETASAYLGYDYFFSGIVVEGNKLGRTIGYPTANLKIQDEHKLIPGNGVYAVQVKINNEGNYKGMMNIGIRPTVNGSKRMIEVNLFDFDKDIYGATLTVVLKKWLRTEQKFDGLEALKKQLALDKQHANSYFQET